MRNLIAFCVLCLFSLFASAQTTNIPVATVQLSWAAPTARENGVALSAAEIGGYEIRYKLKSASTYSYVNLAGSAVTSYALTLPTAGDYDVQIATFDTDSLYSNYVTLTYKLNLSPPKAVNGFSVKRLTIDVLETCAANPNCKVVK